MFAKIFGILKFENGRRLFFYRKVFTLKVYDVYKNCERQNLISRPMPVAKDLKVDPQSGGLRAGIHRLSTPSEIIVLNS